MFQARSVLKATIIFLRVLWKYTFPMQIYLPAIEIDPYSFYRKNLIASLKNEEKTDIWENDDLSLSWAKPHRKKPPFP